MKSDTHIYSLCNEYLQTKSRILDPSFFPKYVYTSKLQQIIKENQIINQDHNAIITLIITMLRVEIRL